MPPLGRPFAVFVSFLVLAYVAAARLAALDPVLPTADLEIRRLGPADGLPGAEVMAFEQTPDRFLWLGTEKGLYRFDGRSFRLFERLGLPAAVAAEAVDSLARDIDGYLFVGLRRSGLMRFTGRTFLAVSRPASGDWRVTVLEERPDGLLWVAGPDQLWHLDRGGSSVKPALPGVGIRHLFTDLYGSTWVAARSGLFRRIGAAFQPVTLPFGRTAPDARALALDGQGHLWLAPAEGGLWRLGGSYDRGGLPQEIAEEDGLDGVLVERALTDRSGRLWLTTSAGLYRQTVSGLEKVPEVKGPCRAIFEDLDGDLWVGGSDGAIWQVYGPHPPPQPRPILAGIRTSSGAEYLPAERLELAPGQSAIQLELAAPYFIPGLRPRFRWKLDGVDDDWQESAAGIADYPTLPAGRHHFRAQASFGPGFAGEELGLEIMLPREPWRDPLIWLAVAASLAVLGGLVFYFLRPGPPPFPDDEDD